MSVETERRAGTSRVPVRTLVEIGAGEGGSAAFEAESVDVTTAGMHLKTAYLPEIGEPLVCRFEAGGDEVVVQGEVAWRNEESYGGDFGVRFLQIDEQSLAALRGVLGEQSLDQADSAQVEPDPSRPQVVRGTRVRMHIEGLGSPMKARVRDGTSAEVCVGSNLEFLRVGRSVDLENVDGGVQRPARIERVTVDIEPTSKVPQLVVALRYLDVAEDDLPNEPAPIAFDENEESLDASPRTRLDGETYDESYDDDDLDDEHGAEQGPGRAAAVWNRVKEVGPKFAVLGGFAKRFGVRAKDVVGDAVLRAKKTAVEKVREHKESKRPVRTTAPPPKGALRGDGTRARTESVDSDDVQVLPPTKKLPKRAAAIALVAVLLTIVAIGFARKGSSSSDNDETTTAENEPTSAETLPVAAGADSASGSAIPTLGGQGAALVANVPLFGPTPMSTAAPLAPPAAIPAPAVAAAVPPAGDDANAAAESDDEAADSEEADDDSEAVAAAPAAAAAPEGDDADEADTDDAPIAAVTPRTEGSKKKTASKKNDGAPPSFGRGRVRNPAIMTLRMSSKIKELHGNPSADGFSVEVVGARSKEPAGGLRRQDSRIASARVVNTGKSARLTIRFNGSAPGYRVQAQGSTLRILLDGDKKTASAKPKRGKAKRR
jgi:hypothetical protein